MTTPSSGAASGNAPDGLDPATLGFDLAALPTGPWGRVVWLHDRLVPVGDATVSVLDRALLRGEGVFEAVRTYGGRPFCVRRHLDRMVASAGATDVALPPIELIRAAIDAVVAANGFHESRIQVTVTGGPGGPTPEPVGNPAPTLILIASALTIAADDPVHTAVTLPWIRHESAVLTGVKPTSYLDHVVGKKWARQHGADEGFWTNSTGQVTEATGANLFVVRDGVVITPPLDAGLLAGITRDLILERCTARGIPTECVPLEVADVQSADECFVTSSPKEAVAVASLDGVTIGTGDRPVLTGILADFRAWAPEHLDP